VLVLPATLPPAYAACQGRAFNISVRVFPGEGVHSEELARLTTSPDRMCNCGDYSFEVVNDDYQQLPLPWWPNACAALLCG
jgi:hypothetical protein